MSDRELKTLFKRQALISFLDTLDHIHQGHANNETAKVNIVSHFQQMDAITRDEIQKITNDVTKAVSNKELRVKLIEYAEKRLGTK